MSTTPDDETDQASSPMPRKRAPRAKRSGAAPAAAKVGRSGKSAKVVVVKDQTPTSPLELRKAVEALTIRNVSNSGEITFLQRKAYNAMLQIAQRNRDKDEITFEVPISEFEELVGHTTSNSREYLKGMLRQLASIQVEFDFKGDSPGRVSSWGIANMVAEVYISPDGSRVKFSFPPELAKRLLDPEMYNRIDMRMQNNFTSYSALTLYEIVSRYFGFAQRETFREHWSAWSLLLSGSNTPHAQFREFNKMLTRAIEQVNTHETRFRIVPHMSKRERKMDKLWFVLEDQQQNRLELASPPTMVSEELMKRLRVLGLNDDEITTISLKFDEDYLLAQADYTEKRMKKKGADPVTSPRAFYMGAVENNYAEAPRRPPKLVAPAAPTPAAALPKPDAKQTMSRMKDTWRQSKLSEIRDMFYAQDEDKRKEILRGIEDDLRKTPQLWQQYSKRGVTKMTEPAILELLQQKHYPEPDAEALLQWALENGALLTPTAQAA